MGGRLSTRVWGLPIAIATASNKGTAGKPFVTKNVMYRLSLGNENVSRTLYAN